MKSEKTIAVASGLDPRQAAELFRGVSDHVAENRLPWRLLPLNHAFEDRLMELAQAGMIDGTIGSFISNRWLDSLLALKIPTVNAFDFACIESAPSVGTDEAGIGRAAARHLGEQGSRRFIFVGEGRLHFVHLRRTGFATALSAREQRQLLELDAGPALTATLESLKRTDGPYGVFCTSDRLARIVVNAARGGPLRPGRDLLVLGVGNDPAESVYAGLGLSSFKIPAHAVGLRAAELLHGQMSEGRTAHRKVIAGEPELLARESSLVPGKSRLAEGVAAYLQAHLADAELSIELLARALGASRRSLETACREYFDESPYQLLAARRLDRARDLLNTTDGSIQSVGERCGYPGQHHFSAWFKKQTGLAPRDYRKQIRGNAKQSAR